MKTLTDLRKRRIRNELIQRSNTIINDLQSLKNSVIQNDIAPKKAIRIFQQNLATFNTNINRLNKIEASIQNKNLSGFVHLDRLNELTRFFNN